MSKERVETFSDGVFAIVLTLLVLGLTVPTIANHSTFSQYAQALTPLIPKLLSFILAFVIIATHWVGHHFFFSRLKKVSLGIVWINNVFLLFICLMPFPTALLGAHFTDQFPIFLMVINQLFATIAFFFLRVFASNNNLFLESEAKKMGPRRTIPALGGYSLSLLFIPINIYIALTFLVLVPVVYFVPNFLDHKFS